MGITVIKGGFWDKDFPQGLKRKSLEGSRAYTNNLKMCGLEQKTVGF
ncbi:hypothetical protein HY212_06220 [Candidatus Pacearchaeota archaeon]|nr:hypothetical protein [Candidatus Pacearchaeota archaeon]